MFLYLNFNITQSYATPPAVHWVMQVTIYTSLIYICELYVLNIFNHLALFVYSLLFCSIRKQFVAYKMNQSSHCHSSSEETALEERKNGKTIDLRDADSVEIAMSTFEDVKEEKRCISSHTCWHACVCCMYPYIIVSYHT